jgi:hypothetical protein
MRCQRAISQPLVRENVVLTIRPLTVPTTRALWGPP